MSTVLFHLFQGPQFQPDFEPPSLESEGFVHLSTAEQVLRTANRWFQQAGELRIAILDQEKLGTELRWEDTHGHGEDFPHLYAPIPPEALLTVARLPRDEGGKFCRPRAMDGYLSPLLDPLPNEPGIIEPTQRFPEKKLPKRCLLCFFQDVLEELRKRPECRTYEGLGSEIGATTVLVLPVEGEEIAVCHPGVGGSLAAATLEELIALGCETFMVCGGAGSLHSEHGMGQLVLVEKAFRDEGTSHHYLPPNPFVSVDLDYHQSLLKALQEHKISVRSGATWTTDALYRETPTRIAHRKKAGCLTVEMEMASLLAVSRFRGVRLGGLLYCGDDVGSDRWDFRDWTSAHTTRAKLFNLSLQLLAGHQ